jgi:hypothetical protein
MRLHYALPVLCLALVACATTQANTLRFTLAVKNADGTEKTQATGAAARMVERRMQSLKQDIKPGDVTIEGDTLSLVIRDPEAEEGLRERLAQPFTLRIMVETDPATADITNENYGSFKETGLTEKHVDWVKAFDDGPNGTARADMQFTEEGKALLKTVFAQNQGKKIGIFVRETLMSLKKVDAKDTTGGITVDGIPSMELASAFADDVNAGLHVVLTEQK